MPAYRGTPSIKLRRPAVVVGGGGAFSPSSLTGLLGWYKADAGVFSDAGVTPATNGSVVAQWNDQSGNSNHLTNSTGGTQPTYATNALNSLPLVNASGSQNLAKSAFALGGTTVSVFMVVQATGGSGAAFGRAVCFGGATNNDTNADAFIAVFYNGANTTPASFSGAAKSTGTITSGAFVELGTIWDGVNNTMYINNTAQTPVASTPTFGASGILEMFNSIPSGNLMTGSMAELVITSGALNSTDRSNLHTYFTNKWGV